MAKECTVGQDEWRFCDGTHNMPGGLCKTCSKAAAQGNHPKFP